MDNLAEHGIAGMVGLIFNGFFAADYIIGLDGVSTGLINGGFLNGNFKQLYIQVAYIVACTVYSFTVSAGIAFLINYIPGLKLRASEEAELLGMDDDQLGEFAYDYVEVRRDYLTWMPESGRTDSSSAEPKREDKHTTRNELRSPISQSVLITGQNDIEMTGITNGEMRNRTPRTSYGGGNEHTGIQGDRHGVAVEDSRRRR
jgi:Amt family ammonium transporter